MLNKMNFLEKNLSILAYLEFKVMLLILTPGGGRRTGGV
jgi:hypothetical protein